MMNVCQMLIPGLLAVTLLVPLTSALDCEEKNGSYVITPLPEDHQWISTLQNSGTVTQGETDRFTKIVSLGETDLSLNLDWGNTANSLSLTICSPGTIVAVLHDADDGTTDGRISINIHRSTGLEPGTWTFLVHGESVHGNEDYTLNWY